MSQTQSCAAGHIARGNAVRSSPAFLLVQEGTDDTCCQSSASRVTGYYRRRCGHCGTSSAHRRVARIHDPCKNRCHFHVGNFQLVPGIRGTCSVCYCAFTGHRYPSVILFWRRRRERRILRRSAGSLSAVGRSHKRRRFFSTCCYGFRPCARAAIRNEKALKPPARVPAARRSPSPRDRIRRPPGCGRCAWRRRGICRRARAGIAACRSAAAAPRRSR